MNPNVKTLEQYSPIRQQQLAEYHAEQARMEELKSLSNKLCNKFS